MTDDDGELDGNLPGVSMLLAQAHARLEHLFSQLVVTLEAGPSENAVNAWIAFDLELFDHFDLEEKYLLPELAQTDPLEAAELRREHSDIRVQLGRLAPGVQTALDGKLATEIAAFRAALAAHAVRQDALMYQWAEANLKRTKQAALRVRLLEADTRFSRSQKPR